MSVSYQMHKVLQPRRGSEQVTVFFRPSFPHRQNQLGRSFQCKALQGCTVPSRTFEELHNVKALAYHVQAG